MTEDETLDNSQIRSKKEIYTEIILWWEKRRIYYNIILLAVVALLLYEHHGFGRDIDWFKHLGYALYLLFVANLCYCAGWISGVFFTRVSGPLQWKPFGRWFLFCIGSLFSILWFGIGYSNALIFGKP